VYNYREGVGWIDTHGAGAHIAVGRSGRAGDELWLRTATNQVYSYNQTYGYNPGRWVDTHRVLTEVDPGFNGEAFGPGLQRRGLRLQGPLLRGERPRLGIHTGVRHVPHRGPRQSRSQ